jgi:hypothetical protein
MIKGRDVWTICPNCGHELVQTILIETWGIKKLGDAEHPKDCSTCEEATT